MNHRCPTADYKVRLVVGLARFLGVGLLGCGGPYVGPCWLCCRVLSGRCAVRVQSITQSAGKDFRDDAVVPFE